VSKLMNNLTNNIGWQIDKFLGLGRLNSAESDLVKMLSEPDYELDRLNNLLNNSGDEFLVPSPNQRIDGSRMVERRANLSVDNLEGNMKWLRNNVKPGKLCVPDAILARLCCERLA